MTTISEKLLTITTNEQTIYNELKDIITLQEEYIYPKITFKFYDEEYIRLESEAYWDSNLALLYPDWGEYMNVGNDHGYATWAIYTIVDSQDNLVKYGDKIKDGEEYHSSLKFEFTINTNDGNSYLIQNNLYMSVTPSFDQFTYEDTRFTFDSSYENVYFTPEENGPTYLLGDRYSTVYIGEIINATLVEEGN